MPTNPFDLPLPVVEDNLLPLLSNRDLSALRLVSKHAKALVEDEVLWKRKVLADFTFPSHASARMGGWYNLYRGLSNPQVYVWGDRGNGRLGLPFDQLQGQVRENVLELRGGVPYPIKLSAIGTLQQQDSQSRRLGTAQEKEQGLGAVVEIVAGGWSFHARSSTGKVWAWGTMDGDWPMGERLPTRHRGRAVPTPQFLHDLPPIKSLSGGRCHAVALTHDNCILEWTAWGSIYQHEALPASVTSAPSPNDGDTSRADVSSVSNIKQLEAGWSFTVILTHTGQVWFWDSTWSDSAFKRAYYPGFDDAATFRDPPGNEHLRRFPINVAPVQLPSIAPERQQQQGQEQLDDADKIVQIAAGEDFIIALTHAGTLHRIDLHVSAPLVDDQLLRQQAQEDPGRVNPMDIIARVEEATKRRYVESRARWERLTAFEDPQLLCGFDSAWLNNKEGVKGSVGKISHVSAHFRQFVTFHTVVPAEGDQKEDAQTLVLLGSSTSTEPQLIPELQARGVIKVTMGDYHYGALTQKGEILTWGSFSKGALGNWEAPWVREANSTTAVDTVDRTIADESVGEQGEGDEGDRGWFGNLVQLPRIIRGPSQRGAFQPRIGFAGRGRVGRAAAPRAGQRQMPQQSQEHVDRPTMIHIRPEPGEGSEATPFAFDLAFAGWHSSALVMDAPATTTQE